MTQNWTVENMFTPHLYNLNKNGIVINHKDLTIIMFSSTMESRRRDIYNSKMLINAVKCFDVSYLLDIMTSYDTGVFDMFEVKDIPKYLIRPNVILLNDNEVLWSSFFTKKNKKSNNIDELVKIECVNFGEYLKKYEEAWAFLSTEEMYDRFIS